MQPQRSGLSLWRDRTATAPQAPDQGNLGGVTIDSTAFHGHEEPSEGLGAFHEGLPSRSASPGLVVIMREAIRPRGVMVRSVAERAMMGTMTVVRIDAITVPEAAGEGLTHRFAERASAVDQGRWLRGDRATPPTDDRPTSLSPAGVTRTPSRHGGSPRTSPTAIGGLPGQGTDRPSVSTHNEPWSYEIEVAVPHRPV